MSTQPGSQFAGSLSLEAARQGTFFGRLTRNNGTSLRIDRVAGDSFDVNGALLTIDPTLLLSNADNLIDVNGLDAGAAMAASTLYYVYVGAPSATDFAGTYRASTTAPTAYNGVLYLGTTGNRRNWRFIGWVATNAATEFVDSDTARLVVNYYNRRPKRLFVCPGYTDDNAQTTFAANLAVWGPINGGAGDSVQWISNGEDSVDFCAVGQASVVAVTAELGIGLDSNVTPAACAVFRSTGQSATVLAAGLLAAGIRTIYLLGYTTGVAVTMVSDRARNGAAADPPATFLSGLVPC